MNVTVRDWTLDDAAFVLKVRNNKSLQKWFRQDHDLTLQEQTEFMRTALDPDHSNRYMGFIVEADGQPVGICALTPCEDFTVEFGIGILPKFQGKGIAYQAMQWMCEKAKQLGYRYIFSDVFSENPAINFYREKCGFVKRLVHPGKYKKAGKPVDAILIEKKL